MADKVLPPKGARLLPMSGQDDLFTLQGYLTKDPIDDNWHNYRDFDKIISSGKLVLATDGKQWLEAEGYNGNSKSFTGYLLYEDRGTIWYDLPTAVAPAPRPLSNFVAKATSWSAIELTWGNSDAMPAELERTDDLSNAFVKIATLPGSATSYTDKNLTGSTPYYYRIRTVSEGGNSEYSGPLKETTSVKESGTPTPGNSNTPSPSTNTKYVSTPSKGQNSDWLSANLILILVGVGALMVVGIVVLAKRD